MEGHVDDENRGMESSGNASCSMYEVQPIEEPYNDERCGLLGSSSPGELGICEDHAIKEHYEGMEFESEDAVKEMEGFLPLSLFMRVKILRLVALIYCILKNVN